MTYFSDLFPAHKAAPPSWMPAMLNYLIKRASDMSLFYKILKPNFLSLIFFPLPRLKAES